VTTPEVSVILVNYNAGGELGLALRSIADDLAGRRWEAVIVDNASSDGSANGVAGFAPQARLLRNEHNLGFARGVNQGFAATSGPLVLIMNPDCRLAVGAFESLRKELEQFDRCAIAGPRILNPDGSIQGSARGDPDMLTGLFGRTTLLRRLWPNLPVSRRNVVSDLSVPAGNGGVEVDWVSGACMLARRDALSAVNGFDERYFLYWEDADLCRRLRARGYRVRYVPGATAIHHVGHSSRDGRSSAIRAFHQSAYLYYATHVASSASPKRFLARGLLALRCWFKLRQSGNFTQGNTFSKKTLFH
jgi:GT2 family glycosyltransferase